MTFDRIRTKVTTNEARIYGSAYTSGTGRGMHVWRQEADMYAENATRREVSYP